MSFKTSLVKLAIEWTPEFLVLWVSNLILKGIAELSDYYIDLDARTAFVQLTLYGETEPIEVSLDGFAVVSDEESRHLIIHQAQSNKPWLHNILSRIVGKTWKIPAIPQYQSQIDFITELLKEESPERQDA